MFHPCVSPLRFAPSPSAPSTYSSEPKAPFGTSQENGRAQELLRTAISLESVAPVYHDLRRSGKPKLETLHIRETRARHPERRLRGRSRLRLPPAELAEPAKPAAYCSPQRQLWVSEESHPSPRSGRHSRSMSPAFAGWHSILFSIPVTHSSRCGLQYAASSAGFHSPAGCKLRYHPRQTPVETTQSVVISLSY
jgi:hypothetical protein